MDEIYHILPQNNMNNQNPESQNQNWRQHNYIEEQRTHNLPRSQNFYAHYPSSQFLNDYRHTGYVYPTILPSYRSGQTSMATSNNQIVNPLNMLPSEDYAKYYSKIQNYIPPDPRLCIKNYPPHPSFYQQPHHYRTTHYHNIGLQNETPTQVINSSVYSHQPYPANPPSKSDKNSKHKNIIVIESDEENQVPILEKKKTTMQKIQEKLFNKEEQSIEKRHSGKQEILQEKNQTIVRVIPPSVVDSVTGQVGKEIHQVQQKNQKNFNPQIGKSIVDNCRQQIQQIIPIQVIDELRDEILEQLETTELPDGTMKIFLTYKTLDTHSKYLESQQISVKVFNLLKIYRAIIEFEKQRKYFIQHIVGNQILKKFNYAPKNRISTDVLLQSKQKINKIAQQINQNIHYIPKTSTNKFSVDHEQNCTNRQKQVSNLLYPPKTKKISKKQSYDRNSEEVSFNTKSKLTEKDQLEPYPSVICERRLRDRKKKKNKKQRYEKSYSQKYLKETQKDQKQKVQSLKADKISTNKQNGKGDAQFSPQEEGLIQKIQGWAERTALAYAIQQKHKKAVKNSAATENSAKIDSNKSSKKDDSLFVKKYKERSTKASQNQFRSMLMEKIEQEKTKQESRLPNLMTFVTANNLSEIEKEEFQKQMTHLAKELRNNENHGKIRIGKEYYQAKMPNFIQSQTELASLIKQKREKLMERKMSVLTF